ncbi:hypothetical protein [Chamaesiphon sp. OTE_8_metabat_110]|uniref:hypothetical protein n=1 Tax=Chamaesiphon sp. OTE_8_metabat_110 TaxID=2964696 RepID=UPI00286D60B7|nr:hypothetical protein [Chamaesiphon sp. OTE_8_metabat_110]
MNQIEQVERDRQLKWHLSETLDRAIEDSQLKHEELQQQEIITNQTISRARNNGNLSLLNFIKIILALPRDIRQDCIKRLFLDPIPPIPPTTRDRLIRLEDRRHVRHQAKIQKAKERIAREIGLEVNS